MNLKQQAVRLKREIPAVYLALKRRETPLIAKILAAITIAYALSPIDLIPDFIPFLGALDDLLLLPIFTALTIRFIPQHIIEECRIESENLWKNGKPKRWFYAIPIIVFWLLIACIIYRQFRNS